MAPPQDTLDRVDDALGHVDHALDALGEILRTSEHTVTVDGIQHELRELVERLHALREDVAGEDDRGE